MDGDAKVQPTTLIRRTDLSPTLWHVAQVFEGLDMRRGLAIDYAARSKG